MEKIVLGIETSCDDTSICLLKGLLESPGKPDVLSHLSFSQEEILHKFGGVVPEIAARNHLDKLLPLLKEAFSQAQIKPSHVDLVGVTTFPGLLGPLLTGLNAAKSFSLLHQVSINPVNHLFAHLEAIFLTEEVAYPYLGLLVSGGHSAFFLVRSEREFELLGSTIDDAAGEAFDKGGKILGIGYPAGRKIDELAKHGDPNKVKFPIGLVGSKDAMLSYSGVKTSLRQYKQKNSSLSYKDGEEQDQEFYDIVASYQNAIVTALVKKTKFALLQAQKDLNSKKELPIVVGGGVACNSLLREKMQDNYKDVNFVAPKFCTDNGAMIANYALRTFSDSYLFPECLELDARSKFLKKAPAKS